MRIFNHYPLFQLSTPEMYQALYGVTHIRVLLTIYSKIWLTRTAVHEANRTHANPPNE